MAQAKSKARVKKTPAKSGVIGSGKTKGINWKFAAPITIVALVGAFGVWKLVDTYAAVSNSTVFYKLVSSNSSMAGLHKLTSTGVDTRLTQEDVFDVSHDHKWYLTRTYTSSSNYAYVAKTLDGTQTVNYGLQGRNCSGNTSQIVITPKFDHAPKTTGGAPGIFYSKTENLCASDYRITNSSIGRVLAGTTQATTIYNSTTVGTSYSLVDVANNASIALTKYAKGASYATLHTRLASGTTYNHGSGADIDLSADGTKVSYRDSARDRYVASVSGASKVKLLASPGGNDFRLNNNGTKAFYTTYTSTNDSRLTALTVSTGAKKDLGLVGIPNAGGAQNIVWNQAGTAIIFDRKEPSNKTYQLRTVQPDGAGLKVLKQFDYATSSFLTIY